MIAPARFPYVQVMPQMGPRGLAPYIPILLSNWGRTEATSGLLDSGSTVNVLPFDLGIRLGADWDKQKLVIPLTGNLAPVTAKAVLLTAAVASFPPVSLAFAWAQTNDVPLLLGQVNFFDEFDVCFFRSGGFVEVKPK